MLKFEARIFGGELPIGLGVIGIAVVLPRGDFLDEGLFVGNAARFLAIWQQISEHYKNSPPDVMFELLNEPKDPLQASLWNQYLEADSGRFHA